MSYKAFISYSHAVDNQLASRLQTALQKFAKPFYRLRHIRIFRDETTLSLTPELWTNIRKALSESEYFIFLASPKAAKSVWVSQEIEEWLKLQDNKLDKFMIVLTEGEIFWNNISRDFDWDKTTALPSVLQGRFNQEPLYLDFRWAKDSTDLSLRNPEFLKGIGKIAAKLHNKDLDEMVGEDVRQHRIFKSAAGAVIVALLFLLTASSSAAYYAYIQKEVAEEQKVEADKQRTYAEDQKKEADSQRDSAIIARNETKVALNREIEAKNFAETKRKEAEQATKNERTAKNQAEERRKEAEEATENERIAKNQAEERRKEAEAQTIKANDSLRAAYLESGRQELMNNSPFRALVYLNRASQIPLAGTGTKNIRNLHFLLGQAIRGIKPLEVSLNHSETVSSAEFSPDEKQFLSVSGGSIRIWDTNTMMNIASLAHLGANKARFSADGKRILSFRHAVPAGKSIKVWDVKSKLELASIENPGYLTAVEFSPNGKRFLTASSSDNSSRIWDIEAKKIIFTLKHSDAVITAKFSPSGAKIITTSVDKTVRIWNANTGDLLNPLEHSAVVYSAEFFPQDENKVLTSSFDGDVKIWSVGTNNSPISLKTKSTSFVAISPDGKIIATSNFGGSNKTIQFWNADTGSRLYEIENPDNVESTSFSQDGNKILVISGDKKVSIWNVDTRRLITTLEHPDKINTAEFSSDGNKVMTTCADGTVKIWDVPDVNIIKVFRLDQPVKAAKFSPSGKNILNTYSASAALWSVSTGKMIFPITHQSFLSSAEFSSDGNKVATASVDKTVRIWDVNTGKMIRSLKHEYSVESAKFSPDGRSVITVARGEKMIRVWDLDIQSDPFVLKHQNSIKYTEFSSDGKKVLTIDSKKIVKLWDLTENGIEIKLPTEFARIAKFSPDGRRIVILGDNNEALIWDFIKDQKSRIPLGHQRDINNAEFSPEGKKIITTSSDKTAKIWTIDTGVLLASLEDQRPIVLVKFSPDGERVATLNNGQIVDIWDVNTGKKLASLKNKVFVNSIDFSPDGERLLTANSDKTVILWDLSYSDINSSELNEFIEKRIPFHLVNGVLVPRLNF